MTSHFQVEGRKLLSNGYLIIPIKPGHKRPAISHWQDSRLGAADLNSYPGHGVGILCGQGAYPICAIDVDVTDAALSARFTAWCNENLGLAAERVGKAPKILLAYRAAQSGWQKAASAWFTDEAGSQHRVEVLGKGQQFVAYHIHPDTGEPYEWVDLLGGLTGMRADDLTVVTEEQVDEALAVFEKMAEEAGLTRKAATTRSVAPQMPVERTKAAEDDFFGRVNQAAMENLGAWVPALLPAAREYNGGYRVSSCDLDRDLEEDISIVPLGIVDYGVADQGDAREGKRTPIDLVLEWAPKTFDDPLSAPLNPREAAEWLCACLNTPKEELGYGLKAQREAIAKRTEKRIALHVLCDKIAACDDSIVLLGEIAAEARKLIATTPELHTEVGVAIKARYRELTGHALPAGDLAKALRPPADSAVFHKRSLTEFGNAERMLDAHGDCLMYVPEFGAWYGWNNNYWKKLPDVQIEHYAKETVRSLCNEHDKHENIAEFHKFVAVSQQAKMVRSMVALAASDPRVVVTAKELDRHANLLGVTNGVIDLTTGKLLEAEKTFHVTKTTGVAYDPAAKAPLFVQTVSDVFFGDQEMVDFFQRVIGYAALGDPTQDIMVIPYGDGSNGKSTVLGTVRYVLGDYSKTAHPDSFVSQEKGGGSAGGAREDLLRLKGSRFVYVGEPEEGAELREGTVKSMTGGDAIPARGLYSRETVEFEPTWVIFMPTNHKPIIKGSDNGIWRRIVMLPFTRNFDKDTTIVKDPNREAKLKSEREGVLAWIVQGALKYQREGLNPPSKVKDAGQSYRESQDLLAEWLGECCEVGPEFEEESQRLWKSWEEYARSRGLLQYIRNSVSLGRRLENRFSTRKDGYGRRIRVGLRVRGDFEQIP